MGDLTVERPDRMVDLTVERPDRMVDLTVESYEDGGAMPLRVYAFTFFGGNYARGSWMFESGFSGIIGLTITSSV